MSSAAPDPEPWTREHHALLRQYGRVQLRCSELLQAQARELARLQAETLRLRAAVVVRETALAWLREDHARVAAVVVTAPAISATGREELRALEESLVAADLVICQAGCLSHGAYWRVRDHCRRTGKPCLLVDQPGAVHIVRFGAAPARGDGQDLKGTYV